MPDVGFVPACGGRFEGNWIGGVRAAAKADLMRSPVEFGVPGTLLYDGKGLSGALARQLELLSNPSLYIADQDGIVRFVDGHIDPETKLAELAAKKGAKS